MQALEPNFLVNNQLVLIFKNVLCLADLALHDDKVPLCPKNLSKGPFVPDLLNLVVWFEDRVELRQFEPAQVVNAKCLPEKILD